MFLVPFPHTIAPEIPINKMRIPLTQHSSMREKTLSGAGEHFSGDWKLISANLWVKSAPAVSTAPWRFPEIDIR